MKKFRNIFATITGLVIGSMVNMCLILLGDKIIPLGAIASMYSREPKHFIFPFLAHALGTLVGAFIATKLSNPKTIIGPMVIGILFLAGGISMVFMVPSPMWFNCVDLILAYIPMAYLGYVLGRK